VDGELKKLGPLPFGAPSKYFLVSKNFLVKCKGSGQGGGVERGWVGRAPFFGKNVPKIIFAIMGGSKYFSDLFQPQFSEHVVQFQHSGAPSGKVGPPFKLTFF
jgi:hypothetical protein